MVTRSFDCAQEALAFVENLEHVNTIDDVASLLEKSLALFGFESFILTRLPHPEQSIEQVILLRKWPAGWFEIYAANDYVRVDPVIRMCRTTVHPFEWNEARYDAELEPRAAEVMNRAAEFRMPRGFCLPMHRATGHGACISMSGVQLDLAARTKPAIHLMALYAFERAWKISCRSTMKVSTASRHRGVGKAVMH
jgi:LuxR family quorum sensing-dependent transcriptional regulator